LVESQVNVNQAIGGDDAIVEGAGHRRQQMGTGGAEVRDHANAERAQVPRPPEAGPLRAPPPHQTAEQERPAARLKDAAEHAHILKGPLLVAAQVAVDGPNVLPLGGAEVDEEDALLLANRPGDGHGSDAERMLEKVRSRIRDVCPAQRRLTGCYEGKRLREQGATAGPA